MQKRLLIGAVCSEVFLERTGEVVKGMIAQAFACNCDIVFISTLYNHMYEWNLHRKNERNLFNLLLSDRFDGFLYDRRFLYNDELCDHIEKMLIRSKKPVMMVDDCEHRLFDNTASDDRSPFCKLTDHLIEVHGYRRIYCLTGPNDSLTAQKRLEGYFDSMNKHGLEYDRTYYRYGDFWKQSAAELADDIIKQIIEKPDAVICGNDIMADTLIEHLTSGGINVPDDIAVVGFDKMSSSRFSKDDLTSYRRANFQLGADSMRRLYRIITGNVARRARPDKEGIFIGNTCGCCRQRTSKHRENHIKETLRSFDNELFSRDIYMECIHEKNLESALLKACEYAFFLHGYSFFEVCLTNYRSSSLSCNTLDIDYTVSTVIKRHASGETVSESVSFKAADILPELVEPHSKPMALFVNILNSIEHEFGYTVLSFGKNICAFSEGYRRFIYEIDNILEHFRTVADYSRQIGYRTDPFTELPVISVYEEVFAGMVSPTTISIEIKDMRKFYLGTPLDKFAAISKRFTELLKSLLKDGEYIAYVTHGVYAVFTQDSSRADALYSALCMSDTSDIFAKDVQLAVGSYTVSEDSEQIIYEAARSAMMNIRYTVSGRSKTNGNPLFEKLCAIRERMAASPQSEWNIDGICNELHVSKSYLQKYYKSHFGISIIENIIQLRLEMAKELLAQTDLSISAIADKCGYSSYIHFTKQFRKFEKITPTEYRRNMRLLFSIK